MGTFDSCGMPNTVGQGATLGGRSQPSSPSGGTARLKRKAEEPSCKLPLKRRLYEERMSMTLGGMNLNESHGTQTASTVDNDRWGSRDEEMTNGLDDTDYYQTAASSSSSAQVPTEEEMSHEVVEKRVVLSRELQDLINEHTKRGALGLPEDQAAPLYRPLTTGKELVLYQPPLSTLLTAHHEEQVKKNDGPSSASGDIKQRICELGEWSGEDMGRQEDGDANAQCIVTYPDSDTGSFTSSQRRSADSETTFTSSCTSPSHGTPPKDEGGAEASFAEAMEID